ncbi:CheY-like protein [Schizopora paradoxa]|uniref:CheY-like protein n=1 Tax=Schizopora paradoxa TaxID=27342 RepID=A0A0H2S254_9AGAM|nr:CheY-like protein [Schizopora paradoxa]
MTALPTHIEVLIADDNPINQTIFSAFFRKCKMNFDIAKDGAEAVQKWKNGEFDLILMDIDMPVMNGIEATKAIRRLEREHMGQMPVTPTESSSSSSIHTRPRAPVIIIALTTLASQANGVEVLAAGCDDFLPRPVSLPSLTNKIKEWVPREDGARIGID